MILFNNCTSVLANPHMLWLLRTDSLVWDLDELFLYDGYTLTHRRFAAWSPWLFPAFPYYSSDSCSSKRNWASRWFGAWVQDMSNTQVACRENIHPSHLQSTNHRESECLGVLVSIGFSLLWFFANRWLDLICKLLRRHHKSLWLMKIILTEIKKKW